MKKLEKIYDFRYLKIYMLLQPIVDVITSFMIRYLSASLTLGMVVRSIFLLYALIYLIFVNKEHKRLKIGYIILVCLYSIGFFVINCTNTFMIQELINYFKFIYYPIILLFFVEILKKSTSKIINGIVIIFNILMLISQITGTYILSYGGDKIGNSGWFYSANELSLILSILFPVMFYIFINKPKKFNIITLFLLLFSMLAIGTKTTYVAVFITLILYLLYLVIYKFVKHEVIGKKVKMTMVVFILFIIFTPITPIYKNMNYHLKYLKIDNILQIFNMNQQSTEGDNDNIIIDENPIDELENLMFYGREQYISDIKPVYFKSNLTHKLFGMGRIVKNKEVIYKYYQVERDIYDIIFQYGILGLIIEIIIPLYLFIILIKKIFKDFKSIICDEVFLYGVSIIIGYLISYMAGHTLICISSATYLSFIFASLYVIIIKKQKEEKKNVMFISSVGGHLTQMLELKSIFNDYNYILITEKTDVTINMKDKYKMGYLKYGSRKYLIRYIFIFVYNVFKSLYLLIKYNPSVIITTGTHTAVPMCYLGWLTDKKVIFIESFAKRTSKTLSGKLVYPVASTFVVQWESMLEFYPNAKYWGGIY